MNKVIPVDKSLIDFAEREHKVAYFKCHEMQWHEPGVIKVDHWAVKSICKCCGFPIQMGHNGNWIKSNC